MRILIYLIWFVLFMFGIYLRMQNKNNVKVPLWMQISSVVLLLVSFYAYIFFIP